MCCCHACYAYDAAQTPQLLRSIGRYLARLDAALSDFWHPGIRQTHDWAIEQVLDAVQQFSHLLPDEAKRWVSGLAAIAVVLQVDGAVA
jgi:Ser/Thr protein kinase RdoA (MazF antagonist)